MGFKVIDSEIAKCEVSSCNHLAYNWGGGGFYTTGVNVKYRSSEILECEISLYPV